MSRANGENSYIERNLLFKNVNDNTFTFEHEDQGRSGLPSMFN